LLFLFLALHFAQIGGIRRSFSVGGFFSHELRELSRIFCWLLLTLRKQGLVYPGVFVGAGHALRPTMFF
jgi:hypothetical protein